MSGAKDYLTDSSPTWLQPVSYDQDGFRRYARQLDTCLAELEQRGRETHATQMAPQALDAPQQFGLFVAAPSAAQEALAALDPDELSPKQALEALYRLRSLL